MIAPPLNDTSCLSKVTDRALDAVDSDDVRNIASRFESTRELAGWIRCLPQRNDTGDESDGPRVKCDVSQRVRIPTDDPNCVERSALFLSAAELIDPTRVRQLATIDTPRGRHTFPVEDDRPIRLDPVIPRNALDAGLFRMGVFEATEFTPAEALSWIARVAAEPALRYAGGPLRLRNARGAFREAVTTGKVPRNAIEDIGFVLAVAEQAARMLGVQGAEMVKLGSLALQHATRNTTHRPRNLSVKIGGLQLGIPSPDLSATFDGLAQVGRRVGHQLSGPALAAVLKYVGVPAPVVSAIQRELKSASGTVPRPARPARSSPHVDPLAAFTLNALVP